MRWIRYFAFCALLFVGCGAPDSVRHLIDSDQVVIELNRQLENLNSDGEMSFAPILPRVATADVSSNGKTICCYDANGSLLLVLIWFPNNTLRGTVFTDSKSSGHLEPLKDAVVTLPGDMVKPIESIRRRLDPWLALAYMLAVCTIIFAVNRNHLSPGGNEAHKILSNDWFTWSLQMSLGLFVGLMLGLRIGKDLMISGFISVDQLFVVIAGGAICSGAFASYYGDHAWMQPSLFDMPIPSRAKGTRTASILVGSLGGALVFVPIGIHLFTVGWPLSKPTAFRVLIVIPAYMLFHAIRTGEAIFGYRLLNRYERPLFFWIYVTGLAFSVFCLLFGR